MGGGSDDISLASSKNQGDGNSQEDIKAEGPSVIIRDSVVIEDVDPAVMPWNSCSEVLQQ